MLACYGHEVAASEKTLADAGASGALWSGEATRGAKGLTRLVLALFGFGVTLDNVGVPGAGSAGRPPRGPDYRVRPRMAARRSLRRGSSRRGANSLWWLITSAASPRSTERRSARSAASRSPTWAW